MRIRRSFRNSVSETTSETEATERAIANGCCDCDGHAHPRLTRAGRRRRTRRRCCSCSSRRHGATVTLTFSALVQRRRAEVVQRNVTDLVSPGLIDWITPVAARAVGRLLDRQRHLDLRLLAVARVLDEHLKTIARWPDVDRVLFEADRLERRSAGWTRHAGDPVAAQDVRATALAVDGFVSRSTTSFHDAGCRARRITRNRRDGDAAHALLVEHD